MAISSSALKGLIGLGAVSTVAIGGTYLYNNWDSFSEKFEEIDNFALDEERTWKATDSNLEASIKDSDPIEVSLTFSTSQENKNWSCQIIGNTTHKNNHTLDISTQLDTIKKEIGINGEGKRVKNKNYNFKKFIESCKKSRITNESNKNSSKSVIKIKKITESNNKYKFDDAELKTHYDGTSEILNRLGLEGKTLTAESQDVPSTIKFTNIDNFTLPASPNTLKLKIEKTDDTQIFPEGLKFTFTSTSEVAQIGKKAGIDTEFKINVNGDSYSLEKAWNATNLAGKINLTCQENTKTCSLSGDKKINFFKSNNSYVKGASFTGNLTFERDKNNHNQGFEFKVSQETSLTGGTDQSISSDDKKLKADKSYEIKPQTINGNIEWFLNEASR